MAEVTPSITFLATCLFMAVNDQVITLPPDSTGKSVDMSELITAAGVTVERERVNISDPSDPDAHVNVRGEAGQGYSLTADSDAIALLQNINDKLDTLIELFMSVL